MRSRLGVCHGLSPFCTSLLASLMHVLVTGEDPRQRRGIGAEAREPTGIFESERLVETNDALLELGCRWDRPPSFLHAGICPLLMLSNLIEAGSLFMPLSDSGSIKIHDCALHILLICTFFCVVFPLSLLYVSQWLWLHRSMHAMALV